MKRGIAAVGAVIAAGLIIERIRALSVAERPYAYCLSCKTQREIEGPKTQVLKNQMTGIRGSCPVCHKGLFSMAGKAA